MSNPSRWPKGFEFLEDEPIEPIGFDKPLNPNITDITRNSKQQIIDFAPYLRLIGSNKISERKNNPSSIFYRALENQQDGERCFQYLLTYKHQSGIIEKETLGILTWILLILSLANFLPYSSFQDIIAISLATMILGVCIFIFGIAPHIEDLNKFDELTFRGRARTPFILFGFLAAIFTCGPSCVSSVYFWVLVIMGGYFLYEKSGMASTSHQMDYAPIFVYIKKETGTNMWKFEKACWDKGHYKATGYNADTRLSTRTKNQKRIMLKIENFWHAFTALTKQDDDKYHDSDWDWIKSAGQHEKIIHTLFYLLVLLVILGFLLLVSPIILIEVAGLYIAGIMCYHFFYLLTKSDKNYQLVHMLNLLDIGSEANRLTHAKLKKLLKLENEAAQLKIREVLQYPFYPNSNHFDSFDR